MKRLDEGYVGAMTTFVIVLGIVAAVVAIGWFVLNRQHPENVSWHDDHVTETTSEQLYGSADRPAGPDASTMDPDALGGDHRPPRG